MGKIERKEFNEPENGMDVCVSYFTWIETSKLCYAYKLKYLIRIIVSTFVHL